MYNFAIVIGIAGFLLSVSLAFLYIRTTHYDEKIPQLQIDVQKLLRSIEGDLKKEVEEICKKTDDKNFENVISIASDFSAVTGLRNELTEMRKTDSANVRQDIFTIGSLSLFVIVDLVDNTPQIDQLVLLLGVMSGFLWALGLYSFGRFYTKMSKLRELIIERREKHPTQEG